MHGAFRNNTQTLHVCREFVEQTSWHIMAMACSEQDTIKDYWLKGADVDTIATAMGCTKKKVTDTIKTIREQWRKDSVERIEDEVSRELAKLNLIEKECWCAWGKEQIGYVTAGKEIMQVVEPPNPQYMKTILDCMTRRAKLLGLDKPSVIKSINTYDLGKASVEQLQRIVNGENPDKVFGGVE